MKKFLHTKVLYYTSSKTVSENFDLSSNQKKGLAVSPGFHLSGCPARTDTVWDPSPQTG